MRESFKELEIYPLLVKVKEELFSYFKSVKSPSLLPEMLKVPIHIEETPEYQECIIAFCNEYEGLYYERFSEVSNEEKGYLIVWYKSLEGIDLRDRVMIGDIK